MRKLLLFLFFSPVCVIAQNGNLPLNDQWMWETEAQMVKSKGFRFPTTLLRYETDTLLHVLIANNDSLRPMEEPTVVAWPGQTSFRPIMEQGHGLRQYYNYHNHGVFRVTKMKERSKFGMWIYNYHRSHSLLQVEKPGKGDVPFFRLYVDPLVNLQYTKMPDDTSGESLYINSRGVIARGDIGRKVSFETSFLENQAFLTAYQDSFALEYGVIPGMGRWKKFKNSGYDYAMASGMLSWSVCPFFNVQVGHGKHFIGDGYRSLLLSDNGFNYPYARFTGWFGPNKSMQYTVMYSSFMNLTDGGVSTPPGTERLFQKKSGVFHHFSWRFLRTFEVSLFQGAIYEHADTMNKQHLGFSYFNPVMFAGMAQYGLGDTNNYVFGATFRADLFKTISLYGQIVMDEMGSGTKAKTGYQVGIRYFNVATVKHLHLRLEMNKVKPYTYSHSDSMQSWSHYNQALAHPLGAGFIEFNGALSYKYSDFFIYASYFWAIADLDTIAVQNIGQDIFKSTPSSAQAFGDEAVVSTLDVHVGWMISYASNLNLSVGYRVRNLTVPGNPPGNLTVYSNPGVYVALRTSLSNTSFDFF